jgi:glyoxylase-like metal-dependent hydrolase (beta-lactamase superfamily II)
MNKKAITVFGGAALSLLLVPYANAQFGTEPAKLDLIKVRDDLYVISNPYVPGLVTALVTDEGVLLVDDKFEIDHDNIMAMLKTVTSQPVTFVINTHYHNDHSGGNAKLQALDAVAIASDQARARMIAANQSGLPNITVGDTAHLYVGGKPVEIHKVGRAHTDGDVVVLFPEHGVIATGDVFTNGEGTSAQLVDHAGGGSAKEWPKAVDAALALDFDTVIPGHGIVATRADLQKYRDQTVRFSSLLSQMVAQGKSRAEIEAVVRSEFAWEDFHVQLGLDGLINELR